MEIWPFRSHIPDEVHNPPSIITVRSPIEDQPYSGTGCFLAQGSILNASWLAPWVM
jgi:hypothetical protein